MKKSVFAYKFIYFLSGGILSAFCAVAAAYMLYAFGYLSALGDIDNVIAVIPIAMAVAFAAGVPILLFVKHKPERAPLFIAVGLVVALSIVLMPKAVRGDWWLVKDYDCGDGQQPDISVYAPFAENSLAATLDAPSELVLTNDLPTLDGALALYPVYAAFAKNTYSRDAFDADPDSVTFTDTLKAYDGIMTGERDAIFAAGASAKQKQKAAELGAELVFTPIGREAFVFVVGKDNPIDDISVKQIRNVYSGKTSRWSTLGWRDGGEIIAFQRPEGSGSQTGLQQVMGNIPIAAPRPLPDDSLIGTNSLMKQISVVYNGVMPALGYTYRFFAQTMYGNADAKILSVDGVAPTDENIKSGKYPFSVRFYIVTNGEPKGNVKRLIDFALSSQGQELVAKSGYVPIV